MEHTVEDIVNIIYKRIGKHKQDIKNCQFTLRENHSTGKARQMVSLMVDSESRILELEDLLRTLGVEEEK